MSRNAPLPLEEAIKRKSIRIAASTSFSSSEINVVSQLLGKLRSGGDARTLLRSTELTNVSRKFEHMKTTLDRQRVRREAKKRI